jgi:hypothetical protein
LAACETTALSAFAEASARLAFSLVEAFGADGSRTTKSSGPGTSTLVSSLAEELSGLNRAGQNLLIREATVAKEPDRRGELDISRKTIACGNAGLIR